MRNLFSRSKSRNRNIAEIDWKMVKGFMAYKSKVVILDLHDTTRGCSGVLDGECAEDRTA